MNLPQPCIINGSHLWFWSSHGGNGESLRPCPLCDKKNFTAVIKIKEYYSSPASHMHRCCMPTGCTRVKWSPWFQDTSQNLMSLMSTLLMTNSQAHKTMLIYYNKNDFNKQIWKQWLKDEWPACTWCTIHWFFFNQKVINISNQLWRSPAAVASAPQLHSGL